jgi:hypothetical protein
MFQTSLIQIQRFGFSEFEIYLAAVCFGFRASSFEFRLELSGLGGMSYARSIGSNRSNSSNPSFILPRDAGEERGGGIERSAAVELLERFELETVHRR